MNAQLNNLKTHIMNSKPTSEKCKAILKRFLPCIPLMRHYQWRQWLFGDIVSGLTLGSIYIPQCLGYATVVQVLPAFGLYSSFFPVLVYFIFGSSHSISIGAVAVISLLAGDFVSLQRNKYSYLFSGGSNNINNTNVTPYTATQITTAMTQSVDTSYATAIAIANTAAFIIGLMQLGMGLLRLGIVSSFMSTPFNSAYMTATAIHTAVSQFPPALGIKISQYPGLFTLPLQLKDIILHLPQTNPADAVAALLSMAVLIFIKEFINVKYRKKLLVPIPAELIVVVIGTFIAYIADLNKKYHLKIVGTIPVGFPAPGVPILLPYIDGDFVVGCITIAIVACVECLTMAKIMARKYRYSIDTNQEFIAYGLVHLISSFFHCFPTAQSPPRTMIFDTTGGKTQLASLIAASTVLIVIVGVGPLFQNLPKACLASVIIVAVFPLIKHVKELKFYWRVQKWDFLGWVLTCLSVLILDLAVGMGVGIGWNLLIILVQSLFVNGYIVSSTKEPDIFIRSGGYCDTREIDGIKIFRFESDLFFANVANFKNQLYKLTVNPNKLMLIRKKIMESESNDKKVCHENPSAVSDGNSNIVNIVMEKSTSNKSTNTRFNKLEHFFKKMLKKAHLGQSSNSKLIPENNLRMATIKNADDTNVIKIDDIGHVNKTFEILTADSFDNTIPNVIASEDATTLTHHNYPAIGENQSEKSQQISVTWKPPEDSKSTGKI